MGNDHLKNQEGERLLVGGKRKTKGWWKGTDCGRKRDGIYNVIQMTHIKFITASGTAQWNSIAKRREKLMASKTNQQRLNRQTYVYCTYRNIYYALYKTLLLKTGKMGMKISLNSIFWGNFFVSLFFFFRLCFSSCKACYFSVGLPKLIYKPVSSCPLSFERFGVSLAKVLLPPPHSDFNEIFQLLCD